MIRQQLSGLVSLMALIFALGGCSSVRDDYVKKPSTALPPATMSPRDRYIQAATNQHPDDSGFRLLISSTNALMSRVALADHAKQSIDLQYYIFENDATGRLIMQRLLAAADRGVRVRLLIDDLDLKNETDMLEALNSHPNIKVRLFNPFTTRNPSILSKAFQLLTDWDKLNRRMHNKSFIVDNNVAIVGGRNIGDDYFHAGNETHFRDLDVIAIGPVVRQASDAFDSYWNCDAAYPVTAYKGHHTSTYNLDKLRAELNHDARTFAQSDYAQAVIDKLPNGPTDDKPGSWFWGPATLVADQPEKITEESGAKSLRIGPQIKAITDQAQHSLLLVSPYFIPGDSGVSYLDAMSQRGVAIKVLTNSLSATDEPEVTAAYSHYRKPLLADGVTLYELRPLPNEENPASAKGRSSGFSLHAKTIVVDRRYAFIGSMNMDPRSKLLNTEMGVIIDCPPLAEAVATQFFDKATSPQNSYQVVLVGHDATHTGHLEWHAENDGKPVVFHSDPDVSVGRRIEVLFLKMLPIQSVL